ncbi:hypothetical protein INT43_002847 [Umbelopsis isabellina]|uniref:Uncharacterized protein n=1 Tax=Mortierella isabellina TaxID=91625 RepID=A0A8H7Q789_MORIS|nr:hypothetical protein INT43_002847 [Umbelopsis isabellina]
MSQDELSESFSKLNAGEDFSEKPQGNDTEVTTATKSAKENRRAVEKAAILERIKRLTKDPEQNILSVIQEACKDTFERKDFNAALQSIKASFYVRDYIGIFTVPENLPVYAAAYIPGRSLCYYEIFRSHPQLVKLLSKDTKMYLPGSGSGSELVGISAAMLHAMPARQRIELIMQDIGDWNGVLKSLESSVRNQWKLDEQQLRCSYEQGDVLDANARRDQLMQEADLITFMFVMNELFVNKAKAMALVQSLVKNMKKGAYLLVVDSAGSFSHLKVGGQTYMIYFLLDAIKSLEKVIGEDSKWYRYPEHLRYPLDIQNMRYFLRLYKKL